ncbi:hypothetical protein HII31_06171 [Pseudocercospora fuligena]|uniref:Uncharacterized protein n=1 Tax=Pseudocercospora fuligena TaxID=685502 RepID=A0A8H6RJX5_9PEZI|nr:hypothetical protein HII31_06171 [Pseudocercospora fuligena]
MKFNMKRIKRTVRTVGVLGGGLIATALTYRTLAKTKHNNQLAKQDLEVEQGSSLPKKAWGEICNLGRKAARIVYCPKCFHNDMRSSIAENVESEEEQHVFGAKSETDLGVEDEGLADDSKSVIDIDREQAYRDETYIMFDNESEEDYTAGPVRFVNASDGVSEVAALLMTMDLSKKIQQAIQAQRAFNKAEQKAILKRRALHNLNREVGFEIRSHQRRLQQKKSSSEEAASAAMKKELEKLQLMQENVQLKRQGVDAQLQSQAVMLRRVQASMTAILEEVFEVSDLVQPQIAEPEVPPEELDLQMEYKAFCKDLEKNCSDENTEGSVAELQMFGQESLMIAKPALTPEQQAKCDASKAFYDAQDQLRDALARFEQRDVARERDRQVARDESEEAFDLRWVHRYRELTRAVIEAEERLDQAKARAIEAGFRVQGESQTSGFTDRDDDGYRESWVAEVLASIPRDSIDAWLAGLPDDADSEWKGTSDADEWEVQEVEICDSVSMVADGSRRRRIDKWQLACGS